MREIRGNYYIGVDLAIKLKWWQRFIVWLGFKKKWWDYSCAVVLEKEKDGTYKMINEYYF